ncbi:porin family protein [Gaetbulibacter aestuarii]|uniref:Porin family protein n=1 Tax=Gaetbulibacter aestuarii TaxID=1502358 RepID=A0ABW7N0M3_9FLAO
MKSTLLFLFLFTLSLSGFSQEDQPKADPNQSTDEYQEQEPVGGMQGIKFGVRGGMTISNLDFDGVPNVTNKHRNSMYIGFLAHLGLSRTVALIPELQFSAEGANKEELHLDYIQLPVMLQFRISEKIKFGLGPQVGLNIPKVDDNLQDLAFSGVAGLEYKINYVMFADLRYNYGLTNIFDTDYGVSAKNRTLQIGIGYKF